MPLGGPERCQVAPDGVTGGRARRPRPPLALTVPERFRQSSIVREGETVEIPVTIRSFRRLTHDLTVAFDLEVWGGALP